MLHVWARRDRVRCALGGNIGVPGGVSWDVRTAAIAPLLLCGCLAAVDTGPSDGAPDPLPTDDDAAAAAAPELVDDEGEVGLPEACVLLAGGEERDTETARQLFMEGTGAFEAGDYASAAEAFCSAYRSEPAPGLLFNIGVTSERMGLLDAAADFFDAFADAETEQTDGGGHLAESARDRARNLRERAPR